MNTLFTAGNTSPPPQHFKFVYVSQSWLDYLCSSYFYWSPQTHQWSLVAKVSKLMLQWKHSW